MGTVASVSSIDTGVNLHRSTTRSEMESCSARGSAKGKFIVHERRRRAGMLRYSNRGARYRELQDRVGWPRRAGSIACIRRRKTIIPSGMALARADSCTPDQSVQLSETLRAW
jgi:hypothetical protein